MGHPRIRTWWSLLGWLQKCLRWKASLQRPLHGNERLRPWVFWHPLRYGRVEGERESDGLVGWTDLHGWPQLTNSDGWGSPIIYSSKCLLDLRCINCRVLPIDFCWSNKWTFDLPSPSCFEQGSPDRNWKTSDLFGPFWEFSPVFSGRHCRDRDLHLGILGDRITWFHSSQVG